MLKHITVISLATVGPGARAAQTLADFGARVIRVSAVAAGKQIEPVFHAYSGSRGQERLRLDLKQEAGRQVLMRLAEQADVLIESFRPGVVKRLGIDHATLSKLNPGLIYCSTTGYGQAGPYAQWAGHDINYLAVSGFLDCGGRDANGCPALPGATVADSAGGGMHACLSIMAALLQRTRDGRGRHLDVSVVDGVLSMMSLHLDKYLATGETTTHESDVLTGRYAWYGVYRTRDDGFVAVGAIETRFYENLCRLLGLEAHLGDQYRDDRQDALREAFRARFLERDRDDWVALLAHQDTCVTPVLGVAEVAADPHLRTRQSFSRAMHEQHGEFLQLAPLWAGLARPECIEIPELDQTREILCKAGYGSEEIEQFLQSQIVE